MLAGVAECLKRCLSRSACALKVIPLLCKSLTSISVSVVKFNNFPQKFSGKEDFFTTYYEVFNLTFP